MIVVYVVGCFSSVKAMNRDLNVVFSVENSHYTRRGRIVNTELEKYTTFGIGEPLPFDKYFLVKRLLINPHVNDSSEKYSFPTHLPQKFINAVALHQKRGNCLSHEIYKDENDNTVTLHYSLEDLEN